jgi:parvulin-like peptidyl-prolyl isomerase
MTKAKSRPNPTLSRKQISRRAREKRQLRWIWIGVAVLTALVVVILAVGLIVQSQQAIAIVNGEPVRVSDYQKRLSFWASNYNSNAGPGAFARLEAEQKNSFYQQVADSLIQEALIRQEADKNGVSVSEQEIEIEIEEQWFGHYRNPPTPTPSPTPSSEATPSAETTPLPTATPDTPEAYQANYEEFVENVLKPAGVSEAEFRDLVRNSLLYDKMQPILVPSVPAEEEQINFRYIVATDALQAAQKRADLEAGVTSEVEARHILVDTEQAALDVLARLQDGEDFVALAAELSTDESNKDNGGDLGWFGRGQMVPEFEKAAFEGELGVYPEPVQTQFGFHVLEILDRADRPYTAEEAMTDAGWYGKSELSERFGSVFAEMLFGSELGLLPDPVPTEFGVAIVETLEREVRPLDEMDQESKRQTLFDQRLQELREEAEIEDKWDASMVPPTLP